MDDAVTILFLVPPIGKHIYDYHLDRNIFQDQPLRTQNVGGFHDIDNDVVFRGYHDMRS